MSRYALADLNAMLDVINYMYQVVFKSMEDPIFILPCHPGLHFRSLSMKCDVERTAHRRGYSIVFRESFTDFLIFRLFGNNSVFG
jgi:hypothetical protein